MTTGLVRKNNLSDLPSPEQARINLGLATADYNRIRGLYASAGVSNVDVQRIAGSLGNYQGQINSLNSTTSGVDATLYANRAGDTLTGTWTNTGRISAISIRQSGTTPAASSDALFTHDYQGGQFQLNASAMVANLGLTVENIVDGGGVEFASGVTTNKLVPITIGSIPYFLEAG
jgi:hypothetical protein